MLPFNVDRLQMSGRNPPTPHSVLYYVFSLKSIVYRAFGMKKYKKILAVIVGLIVFIVIGYFIFTARKISL